MKILVSSKGFSAALKSIDYETINSISIDNKKSLTINFGRHEALVIPVESKDKSIICDVENVRFDLLIEDLSRINEQPIMLDIVDNKISFTLQY